MLDCQAAISGERAFCCLFTISSHLFVSFIIIINYHLIYQRERLYLQLSIRASFCALIVSSASTLTPRWAPSKGEQGFGSLFNFL